MQSQDITENRSGIVIINTIAGNSSYSIVFAARFQSLYSSQWEFPKYEESEFGDSHYLIHYATSKFDDFDYPPTLIYTREIGLSNRDISGSSFYTGNLEGNQYTLRFEILPLGSFSGYTGAAFSREPVPKPAMGFTYDHNQVSVRTRSNSGAYMINDTGFFQTDLNLYL
ncbi:hypothetical protein BH23BAC2_BH23BAC2_14180 [soil metagenome]